jgi:hypothetical protein
MYAPSGRPREFTHPKRRELLQHIGQGATVEEAASIVGVSLRTVQRAAKHNEFFDHDLQLAVHAAPVDPYTMVARAARTHWRAAAWLLERTDPDRFAKRPPNSCRPETLMDISAWLIETALEATAPEQRETVYRRMQAVADKAFNVLMPDQHDARRALVGALPDRPMPLSNHEFTKTLRVVPDRPDLDAPSAPSSPGSPNLGGAASRGAPQARPLAPPAAAQLQEAGRPARLNGTAADATAVADPVAFYRAQPPRKPSAAYPRTHIEGFRLLDSDRMDAEWRYPLPEEDADEDRVAPVAGPPATGVAQRQEVVPPQPPVPVGTLVGEDANLCHPTSSTLVGPPNEGIMSPKMSAATERSSPGSPNLGGAAAGGAPQARRLVPPAAAQLQEAGRSDGIANHKAGDGIAGRMSA